MSGSSIEARRLNIRPTVCSSISREGPRKCWPLCSRVVRAFDSKCSPGAAARRSTSLAPLSLLEHDVDGEACGQEQLGPMFWKLPAFVQRNDVVVGRGEQLFSDPRP